MPSFSNPLVAVESKDEEYYFNFTLLNGEKTKMDSDGVVLSEKRFDPDAVKRVVLCFYEPDG